MKNTARTALALAALLALAACKPHDEPASQSATEPTTPAATDNAATGPKTQSFDISSIPVSTVALGDFPYLALPTGYTSEGRNHVSKDFARFPFWIKGEPRWVEGKFYGAEFVPAEGREMSEFEVKKNFEALITQMGGQKISEEKIPNETVEGWGDEIAQGFNGALGDVYNEPATTYVVRRNDGNIWVHLVTNSAQGWYLVGQEKAFAQTAQLIPASQLKQQLDSAGKVALQVNFATDKTEMLPDSLPQIDQVVQLLRDDPALKLSVNGHTDNTGDAAHNQKLSEGRAGAVVAAIVAKGIDAARLSAKGFGQDQPVADNKTEEGKAKNRRVELVKQS
ncbi:OmpA family protein [Pseudoxanthomonas helianthi]|uniref:OmpA family protein n=1 Tax=Pseudoxanthomonas helianthi TaxID=1453541 RepID=A0A940X397_9GAMM|nr:OmpA family protein [Pseudoxanthomonas helianthi]